MHCGCSVNLEAYILSMFCGIDILDGGNNKVFLTQFTYEFRTLGMDVSAALPPSSVCQCAILGKLTGPLPFGSNPLTEPH